MIEKEFNERLEKQKKFEENRAVALAFYFEYSVWGNPYYLHMYEDCIGLIFYDSDGDQRDEMADFSDKNFNKDLQTIRRICDELTQTHKAS